MRKRLSGLCTENLIRIDCVTESPNVNGDDRALLPLPDPVRLAVQVEEPTWSRERGAPSSTDCAAAQGAGSRPAHKWGSLVLGPAVSMFPSVLRAITIIRPETLVRWHRAGFRHYWRWKSRSFGGRPKIARQTLASGISAPQRVRRPRGGRRRLYPPPPAGGGRGYAPDPISKKKKDRQKTFPFPLTARRQRSGLCARHECSRITYHTMTAPAASSANRTSASSRSSLPIAIVVESPICDRIE